MAVDAGKSLAFLSYVRDDDLALDGGITWLREQLERTLKVVTGKAFPIFQDESGIELGEHWPSRLEEALSDARFLIPVLTPSYFNSEACRREAVLFLDFEAKAGREDLVLPIYLIEAEVLEDAVLRRGDPLARRFHQRQRADWREVAFGLREASDINGRIADLARKIATAAKRDRASIPPPIPDQGLGPHFRINEEGLIDRAPDDPQASTENEARMASLQVGLQAGCDRLLGAGISQNAFGFLIDDIKAYQEAISPPVRDIQFTDVWRLGLVLQDHADAVSRNVDRLAPSLEDVQQAALKSLVGLHGPFILSSEEGRALQALSNENRSTRDELQQLEAASQLLVQAVKDSTNLVSDAARDLIEDANRGIAEGRYPERHAVTAQTTNQNFLSIVGMAATFVGTAAAGAVVGEAAITSGAGGELVSICTQTIEAASGFLVSHEMVLKGLAAASGEGLSWLPHLVSWAKVRRGQKRNSNPAPTVEPSFSSVLSGPLSRPPGTVFRDIEAPWCPEMVVIPAGAFMMGSPEDEEERRDNEGPQHLVTIKRPFVLGRYPVTFEEFDHYCDQIGQEKPEDQGWGRGRRPVINVSWEEASCYCSWLTELTGVRYQLPSEALWEYACRAGTETRFSFGDGITVDQANFETDVGKTSEVGAYTSNTFGLFDMHGNVLEWCEDRYKGTYEDAPTDGASWLSGDGTLRVVRGGSWIDYARDVRSAFRLWNEPGDRFSLLGFRCAGVQA